MLIARNRRRADARVSSRRPNGCLSHRYRVVRSRGFPFVLSLFLFRSFTRSLTCLSLSLSFFSLLVPDIFAQTGERACYRTMDARNPRGIEPTDRPLRQWLRLRLGVEGSTRDATRRGRRRDALPPNSVRRGRKGGRASGRRERERERCRCFSFHTRRWIGRCAGNVGLDTYGEFVTAGRGAVSPQYPFIVSLRVLVTRHKR